MEFELKISSKHFREIKNHLYPGDNKEAATIGLCGYHLKDNKVVFLVNELTPIPYTECVIRESDLLKWDTKTILPVFEKMMKRNMCLIKFHSHPTGVENFSQTDDNSDKELFSSAFGWNNEFDFHLSAILLPDDRIVCRVVNKDLGFLDLNKLTIVGDDISIVNFNSIEEDEIDNKNIQAFGLGTVHQLKKMKIAVIGCSGTGSPVIEQLARLGVGELVLVDPDIIEKKNLNRILNSTVEDANNKKPKVEIFKEIISKIGFNTQVKAFQKNICTDIEVVKEVADSDFIFGCVDSIDARHIMNKISAFYLIPFLDIGIKLVSDGKGSIDSINGTVNYIKPFGTSLLQRGVYTVNQLNAAFLHSSNPEEYSKRKKNGYIEDIYVESPAVISVNMLFAALAVNEFLARIHSFRLSSSEEANIIRGALHDPYIMYQGTSDVENDIELERYYGRGDMNPFLNMPEFS